MVQQSGSSWLGIDRQVVQILLLRCLVTLFKSVSLWTSCIHSRIGSDRYYAVGQGQIREKLSFRRIL